MENVLEAGASLKSRVAGFVRAPTSFTKGLFYGELPHTA